MKYQLKFDIQSYWHPGTGMGRGSDVDAIVQKSAQGLPMLAGRTIKGLLRDALMRWQYFEGDQNSSVDITQTLLGTDYRDTTEHQDEQPKESVPTSPGLLRIANATLPADEAAYLGQKGNDEKEAAEFASLRAGLYHTLHATAINHQRGIAEAKSLRGIEVIVPLTLYAPIDIIVSAVTDDDLPDWPEHLRQALPLIQAVGGHRTRGLGRAIVTLEEVQS